MEKIMESDRIAEIAEIKDNSIVLYSSVILWFISLLSGTGIGNALNIYGKLILVLFICLAYQMLFKGKFQKIDKTLMLCILEILFQNLYSHLMYKQHFLEYAAIYMIPVLYSIYTVNEKQMRIIGMVYGIGGGMILLVANYTRYFAGWDGNTVSQNCFFSYAAFIASLFDINKKEHRRNIVIYSIAYFVLLWTLHSRSCILFSLVLLLCALDVIPVKRFINKNNIIIWLLVPLIVAIVIVSINNAEFVEVLNNWSMQHFSKPMFNGRDSIWSRGIRIWAEYPLLGIGTFNMNWHNSAIACLTGAGIVGYSIWIYIIKRILVNACKYMEDNIILGTITAFIVVWMQQSVEQGMIGLYGSPAIFVLLGLILARTNTLRKQEDEKSLNLEQKNV